jgi:hypothetical protein
MKLLYSSSQCSTTSLKDHEVSLETNEIFKPRDSNKQTSAVVTNDNDGGWDMDLEEEPDMGMV